MKERTYSEQVDTMREDDAVCPYCGYRDVYAGEHMERTTDDGDTVDVSCPECNELYRLTFNFTFTYTTERMEEV